MNKYRVSVSSYTHYVEEEIEATNEEEAEEIYIEMVMNGEVEEVDSYYTGVEVKQI